MTGCLFDIFSQKVYIFVLLLYIESMYKYIFFYTIESPEKMLSLDDYI